MTCLLLGGTPAAAQEPITEKLLIQPAPGSQTDPAASYFVVKSRPGATIRQQLQISSEYRRPVELRVTAVDAVTASTGGVAYELPDAPVDDEGAWIKLDRERLTLAPGQTGRIPFQVDVPEETESGVHLAGLAVAIVDPSKPDPAPTQGGAVVDFRNRFVVAVQVDLPGNSEPELVITGVEPAIGTAGVTLEVLIENVGFGLTKGEGVLELPDEGFEEALPLGTVVPGTSIRYPVAWLPDPAEGEYAARVAMSYSEDDPDLLTGRASWEGTFVIGEAQTGELDRLQGGDEFNWLLIIIPAVVLLLLLAFLVLRRRRRTTPKPTGTSPQPSARPAPAPQQGYTGGYTGSAEGTFGGAARPQQQQPQQSPQPTSQTPQQRPPGTPPPPPPPPPKKGP